MPNIPKNRDSISLYKIFSAIRVIASGSTRKADAYLKKFTDIHLDTLERVTGKKISSFILDIDDCIAPDKAPILPENIQKIKDLLSENICIGVYSNSLLEERLIPLQHLGVQIYAGTIPKPHPRGFLEACAHFQFQPDETWMIGENPITDGGALRVLGGTIFIEPIPEVKLKKTMSLKRALFVALRRLAIWRTLYRNAAIFRG